MPQALSTEKRAHIQGFLELGVSRKDITNRVGVSECQVTQIKHNIVYYGSVMHPKKPSQGRQPKIMEGMTEVYVVSSEQVVDFR